MKLAYNENVINTLLQEYVKCPKQSDRYDFLHF